jgi:drug/metabolite transporter (DMT)-like permease
MTAPTPEPPAASDQAGEAGSTAAANGAILFSTLLWGTLWIPMRQMEAAGLAGAPAPAFGFLIGLIVLLPFGLARLRRVLGGGWPVAVAGFFMAATIALYAEGLVRGQVARVILLFYLTPVWSTLLGRARRSPRGAS